MPKTVFLLSFVRSWTRILRSSSIDRISRSRIDRDQNWKPKRSTMRPLQSSARVARVGAGSRVSTSSSPSSSSAPAPPRRRSSRAPRSATSVGSALASQVVPSLPYDLQEGVEVEEGEGEREG